MSSIRGPLGALAIVLAGCASSMERPTPPPRPPSAAEREMNYQEAIDLGANYLAEHGRPEAQPQSAQKVEPHLWVVRFGLAPKGSGRRVDVYIDDSERKLVKIEEVGGVHATEARVQ